MPTKQEGQGERRLPAETLIHELMAELGRAFDLETPLGDTTLGEAVERRVRSLNLAEGPEWGSHGSLTQVAREESDALDFLYRPHLFPEMEDTLRLGHRLQFDLLPRRLPAQSPLRIAAVLESYCHLSGDLLGWRMEGGELFAWIADVSGHGVRAGLAGATLYFLIGSIEHGLEPHDFARSANRGMLAARNPDDRKALFATAVWLRARPGGSIRYASAGHNPALVVRSDGTVEMIEATGPPIGMFPDEEYELGELQLGAGDALCLYTDGVVEARDPGGRELGLDRLAEHCREHHDRTPSELARSIYTAVREHQGSNLLGDDLTFLIADPARREADS